MLEMHTLLYIIYHIDWRGEIPALVHYTVGGKCIDQQHISAGSTLDASKQTVLKYLS